MREEPTGTTLRAMTRVEVEAVWSIDRREVIEAMYALEDGALVLRREHHDVRGWPAGEAEHAAPVLLDCFDRGGWCDGAFDEERLVAAAILDARFIGPLHDRLQLVFLHVGRAHRGRGIATALFERARREARSRGARRLYVSATPSQRTVEFYLARGCRVTAHPDPALLALEPEDIHFECDVE